MKGKSTCEGLCDPSKCQNPGNVCVDNLCALPCGGDADCVLGESCVAATADGKGGAAISICQNNGRSAIGSKCPSGNECASLAPSCPDGSNCDYTQCGGGTCTPDPVACGASATCALGKCSDGTRCTVQGCAAAQCKPLVCVSAGLGDADAYCTLQDCTADANCPGGYFCDAVRDSHPLCGAPASKIPALCGAACMASPSCVKTYGAGATCANIGASGTGYCEAACVMPGAGTTYKQGTYCTERNECQPRGPCDPCATDLDCAAVPGMHCVSIGGAKACALDCGTDTDCADGFQCTKGECVPRGGACSGATGFCEPCRHDGDCASGTYCSISHGHVCVALLGTVDCMADADCPKSPAGLHGKCMDQSVESSPGDGIYHTCWLPYFASVDSFQCWGNNAGDSCGVDADCFSKTCVGAVAATGTLGTCM